MIIMKKVNLMNKRWNKRNKNRKNLKQKEKKY